MLVCLVFEMPLCLFEMYNCALVISIWRWVLKFDMLITTDNRVFVRKCGGWCNYLKFAFKLVFL